jgi:ribosomal RNA assembly protein
VDLQLASGEYFLSEDAKKKKKEETKKSEKKVENEAKSHQRKQLRENEFKAPAPKSAPKKKSSVDNRSASEIAQSVLSKVLLLLLLPANSLLFITIRY